MKFIKNIFAVIGLLVMLLCACVFLFSKLPSSTSVDTTPASGGTVVSPTRARATARPTALPALVLVEHSTMVDSYVRYIVGTVKNNSKKTYSYVQIQFNLYDASGAQVGSTMANVNNLEPGGLWKFKALILEDATASYKLLDITGW